MAKTNIEFFLGGVQMGMASQKGEIIKGTNCRIN